MENKYIKPYDFKISATFKKPKANEVLNTGITNKHYLLDAELLKQDLNKREITPVDAYSLATTLSQTKQPYLQQILDGLYAALSERNRGALVDLIAEYAMKENIDKDAVCSLVSLFESFEHFGKISTYEWLTGKKPLIQIDNDEPVTLED